LGHGKSVVNTKIGFDRMAFSASSSAHYDVETYSRAHRPGDCAAQLAGNDGEIGWAGNINSATHCAGWCPGSPVQGRYLQIEPDRDLGDAAPDHHQHSKIILQGLRHHPTLIGERPVLARVTGPALGPRSVLFGCWSEKVVE